MLSNKIIHCETYEEALEIWNMFDGGSYPTGYFTECKFEEWANPDRKGFAFEVEADDGIVNFGYFDYFKAEPSFSTYEILEASDLLGAAEVFVEAFSLEFLLGGDLQ